MTLPSDLPAELAHRGVRPVDRLGFTLFLAALIHLALLAAALWHMWTWFKILPKTMPWDGRRTAST